MRQSLLARRTLSPSTSPRAALQPGDRYRAVLEGIADLGGEVV